MTTMNWWATWQCRHPCIQAASSAWSRPAIRHSGSHHCVFLSSSSSSASLKRRPNMHSSVSVASVTVNTLSNCTAGAYILGGWGLDPWKYIGIGFRDKFWVRVRFRVEVSIRERVRFKVRIRVRVGVRVSFTFASVLECTGIWNLLLATAAPSYSGHESLKIYSRVRVCLDSPKMSHSFIQSCCWITLHVSYHHGLKTFVNYRR